MILIRGRIAVYAELWFDEPVPDSHGADVVMYRLRSSPPEDATCTPFHSLASDLTLGPDALFASFGGTNRYKIKRADAKDALTGEFFERPADHIEAFCRFYDAFADQKRLPRAYRRGLEAVCAADRLVLSAATCEGQRIVWHAYVRDGAIASLLHSASHFRAQGIDRALIGRANRWLHWKDMLGFHALGVARYDWGGMFGDENIPEQASINNFKREFGGTACRRYNGIAGATLKGRAYVALKGWLGGGRTGAEPAA
jgi:hypothetical protein